MRLTVHPMFAVFCGTFQSPRRTKASVNGCTYKFLVLMLVDASHAKSCMKKVHDARQRTMYSFKLMFLILVFAFGSLR